MSIDHKIYWSAMTAISFFLTFGLYKDDSKLFWLIGTIPLWGSLLGAMTVILFFKALTFFNLVEVFIEKRKKNSNPPDGLE